MATSTADICSFLSLSRVPALSAGGTSWGQPLFSQRGRHPQFFGARGSIKVRLLTPPGRRRVSRPAASRVTKATSAPRLSSPTGRSTRVSSHPQRFAVRFLRRVVHPSTRGLHGSCSVFVASASSVAIVSGSTSLRALAASKSLKPGGGGGGVKGIKVSTHENAREHRFAS